QDLLDATRWYLEEAGPLRARQFETEIHRSLSLLVRLPALGAPIRHGVRKLPLRRFPYSLVYRDESGLIRVLALAHSVASPGTGRSGARDTWANTANSLATYQTRR